LNCHVCCFSHLQFHVYCWIIHYICDRDGSLVLPKHYFRPFWARGKVTFLCNRRPEICTTKNTQGRHNKKLRFVCTFSPIPCLPEEFLCVRQM
jgi:hypothetical protein